MGAFRGATDPDVLKQIFAGAIYVANLHARRTPPRPWGSPSPSAGLA